MDSVWTTEVDTLGYRAPLSDGVKGGSPQFDVYLKDLGGDLYGFCAGETRVKKRTGSGYCVLDNDFAAAQFPTGTPEGNLRVTAAHEFFHAIQYAYDYAEDPWMMESTATWMEERYATDVNDNVQYLPWSQLYAPYLPLDLFSRTEGAYQYGNWTFWEYLSSQYGTRIVNKAWKQSGSLKSDGGKNSIPALQKVLKGKGGLTKVYGRYAAANLTPATTYPEGAAYPAPRLKGVKTLNKGKKKKFSIRVHHLSSRSYAYVPGKGTSGKKWKLSLKVSGPAKKTSPAAVVVLRLLNGKLQTKSVKLNSYGRRSHQGVVQQEAGRRGHGEPGQRLHPLHLQQAHPAGLRRQAAGRQGALLSAGARGQALISSRAWSAATHSATNADTGTGRSPVGTADQVSARSSV